MKLTMSAVASLLFTHRDKEADQHEVEVETEKVEELRSQRRQLRRAARSVRDTSADLRRMAQSVLDDTRSTKR